MGEHKLMGSLEEKLMCYVSTSLVHDSNYEIASAMVKNYMKLKSMSLGEIADLCYVSKSAISRFVRFVGFDSFMEFQNALKQEFQISNDYSQSFQTKLNNNLQDAYTSYCEDLCSNICSVVKEENVNNITKITKKIYESKRTAYFSHHFLWDIGHHFQGKMMMMNRFIELHNSYEHQLECARELKKDDLAIVCSIGGSYPARYDEIWKALINSGCKIIVITQNMASSYWNSADFVLQCGEANKNDMGKYAALLISDLIIMDYMKLLHDKGRRI